MNFPQVLHRHRLNLLGRLDRPIVVLGRNIVQHLLYLGCIQKARLEALHDEGLHVERAKIDAEPAVGTVNRHDDGTTMVPHGFQSVVQGVFVSRAVDQYVDLPEVTGGLQSSRDCGCVGEGDGLETSRRIRWNGTVGSVDVRYAFILEQLESRGADSTSSTWSPVRT